MDERHLNFNNFITQRANEIIKFTQSLQLNTNKRTHQSLPKSIRRRAMSHNRYRIPIKMRKPLQQELIKSESMQKIPKSRKNIRKRHRLILSYKQRSDKIKWLNTHLWAAKRMRMSQHAGFKIAQSPNNKSFRSAYRHFRHNACLMDYSYLQCLRIKIKDGVKNYILPEQIRVKQGRKIKDYNKLYEGQLYSITSKQKQQIKQFICPILIFPESNQIIRCFFDPICLQQVKQINWNSNHMQMEQKIEYQIQISNSKCELYLILGPEALTRAKQAMQKLSILDNKLSHMFQSSNDIIMSSNNFMVINPQIQNNVEIKKPMICCQINQKIIQTYNPNQNKKIRQLFFSTLTTNREKKKSNSHDQIRDNVKFWSFYDQLAKVTHENNGKNFYPINKITNRSKYTHKRKNKLTKQDKKKVLIQQAQKRQKNMEKTPDKNITQPPKIIPQKMQQQQQKTNKTIIKCNPIMIAPFTNFNSTNSMYKGCFLLCSNQESCIIWKALSQTNLKVIGRKQHRHCVFEADLRFFPDDYVEAKGFQNYNKSRAIQLINKQKRYPPQKRTNYPKINSPFPFYFYKPQNNDSLLTIVNVSMVSRGRCFPGSYLCRIEPEDYDKILNQMDNKGVVKSITCQQKQQKDNKNLEVDYKCLPYEKIVSILSQVSFQKTKRKVIGFITYGGYKQSECRQAGIGYIIEQKGSNENNFEMNQYVLVRKPTSRFYFVGFIRRI